jgi:hypothetical protein
LSEGTSKFDGSTGVAGAAASAAGCVVVAPAGAVAGASEVAGAALGATPWVCAASAAHKKLETVTEITTCEIRMSLSLPGFLFALPHRRTCVESEQNPEIDSRSNRRRLSFGLAAPPFPWMRRQASTEYMTAASITPRNLRGQTVFHFPTQATRIVRARHTQMADESKIGSLQLG